jgi:3-methyl-2-oxobutanoate hydroxymethyltransferase
MQEGKTVVADLIRMKKKGRKIPVLTSYDYTMTKLLERAGVPVILVGDSLGQVVLGYDSTLPVTMEEMIHHCRAVTRARPKALVIGDMPFLSFQIDPPSAMAAAGRMVKEARVDAVKLEGGARSIEAIKQITTAGIPVMGHLGLTPQSILGFSGYRLQGRGEAARQVLLDDARRIEEAGAFAMVLEMIPAPLAEEISQAVSIPTIGIGAGVGCDGQVLVLHDMLGLFDDFTPRFVRRFLEGGALIESAVRDYVSAVETGEYPAREHSYGLDEKGEK